MKEAMRAIVVGSANTDLIIHVDKLPPAGNMRVGGGFKSGPGGKGANQAVCLSKLGVHTQLIARFGGDDFSTVLRNAIADYGVELSSSVIDTTATGGVVFIIVDKGGNNTMVADLGANLSLGAQDVTEAARQISESDFLLLQFEVPEHANVKACELAREAGVPVIVNPAPMRSFDLSLLSLVDLFTPNVQELSEVLGFLEGAPTIGLEERDLHTIGAAARSLLSHGARNIVVTAGISGCVLVNNSGMKTFGTYSVTQVDSTGAGDAFTAGLALTYAETGDIDRSIQFASACAALSVTRVGAIPSMPERDEVETFMKNNSMGTP
jgi:ribokinase